MNKLDTEKDNNLKEIINARDYRNMVPPGEYPIPGEYVITGLQVGNNNGEKGWDKYIGYVVQVRKKAGAYGSSVILIRHPGGDLIAHENQSFFCVSSFWKKQIKTLYSEDDIEEYSQPYTINDEYPETGKIIEPKKDGYHGKNTGSITTITVIRADGTKTIETIV